MKKPIVFALLLALPVLGFSQKDCEIKARVDEFTGDTIISSPFLTLQTLLTNNGGGTYRAGAAFVSKNGAIGMALKLTTNSIGSIAAGETLYVKFKNGEVLELANRFDCLTDFEYSFLMKENENVYKLEFLLTASDLDKLATMPIEKMRITSSKGYLVTEVRKKQAGGFIGCAKNFQDFLEKN